MIVAASPINRPTSLSSQEKVWNNMEKGEEEL
jgi:hypothetical protein